MNLRSLLLLLVGCAALFAAENPNIVLIYADDIGYGDLSCYGATRVQTPNLDRMAAQGLRFTDAHCSSATCTPSRYSMLTGEYAFRQKRARVLPGDAPALILPGRVTLASMLKKQGYRTAVVGKWHLGLGNGNVDWNGDVKPGPLEIGFDYSFLIPATGDRVPCIYLENHRVVDLNAKDPIRVSFREPVGDEPTGHEHPEYLKMSPSHGHDRTIINGISRIGYMAGGRAARWVDEDMADRITRTATDWIDAHVAEHGDRPFFLYYSTHDIHVPRVPAGRFRGASLMGPRGDTIAQLDWAAGEILAAIERHGLTDDTLVIFSSDNGPVIDDGYQDEAVTKLGDHRAAGPFRGGKYSNFEGGTRVPMIVRWPGRVRQGVSDTLISQVDFLASFAALTGYSLPRDAAPDSFDTLNALLGKSKQGRTELVEQARALSLRQRQWKYIEPNDGPAYNRNTDTELGNSSEPQLYNLAADLGEQKNVAGENPEKAREMAAALERIRSAAKTRPE